MPDQPQDIFQEVEPSPPVPAPVPAPRPMTPRTPTPLPSPSAPTGTPRWVWLAVGAVVLLAGIGTAAFLVRRSAPTNANTAKSVNANVPATHSVKTNTSLTIVTPPTGPADADADGLPDTEEAKLGTNPKLADTDRDGLSDYDEVRIYHTNPLKPDTDGDGNPDGTEVKMGYNPNGPGKLLDVSAAKVKLTQPSPTNTNSTP